MNELTSKKLLTLDSREVAEMVSKRHSDLLRDIETYISYLGQNAKLRSDDFFLESNYKAGTGKSYKCYQITKKGCEMIANKLTGQKGVLFTATYINRFHEMEDQLQPQSIEDLIILQAKSVKELKQQVNQQQEQITATQESVQGMRDVIKLDTTSWRKDTTSLINKIARTLGGYENIRQIRTESYDLLNKRMGVSLQTRLTNKRRRMADEGVCKSRRDRLSHLDIIADDKKLIEGYAAIVKEMAIKYGVA